MIELAEKDLSELLKSKQKWENDLKIFLLPKDEADTKKAIIEIRAGTGGLEASLFASDLFKMYEKVSHKKKLILKYNCSSIISKYISTTQNVRHQEKNTRTKSISLRKMVH